MSKRRRGDFKVLVGISVFKVGMAKLTAVPKAGTGATKHLIDDEVDFVFFVVKDIFSLVKVAIKKVNVCF